VPFLLFILIALAALVWAVGKFGGGPAATAKLVQQGGGVASLAGAALLLLRGRIDVALGLAGLGLYLLGFSSTAHWSGIFNKMGGAGGGQTSRVRSAMIEMELDHASGAMSGVVLAGAYEGRKLAELARPQCEEIYQACLRDDPDGARLLEAYLDRRFAGWRGANQRDENPGAGTGPKGKMSEDEAYEILGLAKGASGEQIARAHRSLMKKLHPDLGGTTSLAARVNEAKDTLMRRHT